VLKQVEELPLRTVGHTGWSTLHTALAVREDEFMSAYQRLWGTLPEWDFDVTTLHTLSREEAESLPARTGVHGGFDIPWKEALGRGQTVYDWDTDAMHLYPAIPHDGSMATYTPGDIRAYYGASQRG
jgi:hypothetical protein